MRKILCLLCVLSVLCLTAPGLAEDADAFMADKARQMAAAVSECALSPEYLGYFVSDQGMTDRAAELGEGLRGEPRQGLTLMPDTERMAAALNADLEGLNSLARMNLLRRMPGALMTQMIAQGDVNDTALSSILQLTDICPAPQGMPDSVVVILDYGTGAAACCLFTLYGEAVSCTAMPMAWGDGARENLDLMSSLGLFELRQMPF